MEGFVSAKTNEILRFVFVTVLCFSVCVVIVDMAIVVWVWVCADMTMVIPLGCEHAFALSCFW